MNVVTDNTQVILNLEQENEQLKARIARLESATRNMLVWVHSTVSSETFNSLLNAYTYTESVLNETKQQSLAEIQADAVEHFADVYSSTCNEEWYHSFASEYAEQLRNSVKDGE